MTMYEHELNNYRYLNTFAKQGGVVLFGSTFAKNIPVGELVQSLELSCSLYNRSLPALSVFDASAVLQDCVYALKPERLLLQLGETDLAAGYKISDIIARYETLLASLRMHLRECRITLISVCDAAHADAAAALNEKIKELAAHTASRYVDISDNLLQDASEAKAFCMLKSCFYSRMTDYDALHFAFA